MVNICNHIKIVIKNESQGSRNRTAYLKDGDRLIELFSFAYRHEVHAWLFWLGGNHCPDEFKTTVFPMQFFMDACKVKAFGYLKRLPDEVIIKEGLKLTKVPADPFLKKLTDLRSRAFDIAASGRHGEYPYDDTFFDEVEEGFSQDGTSWTAKDGTTITI